MYYIAMLCKIININYPVIYHFLKKLNRRNPTIGYCQGLNFIVAKILQVVTKEEVNKF